MKYPPKWRSGELLDVRNMGTHYRVRRLNDIDSEPHLELDLTACQDFTSWWYWPQRDGRHEPDVDPAEKPPVERLEPVRINRRKPR